MPDKGSRGIGAPDRRWMAARSGPRSGGVPGAISRRRMGMGVESMDPGVAPIRHQGAPDRDRGMPLAEAHGWSGTPDHLLSFRTEEHISMPRRFLPSLPSPRRSARLGALFLTLAGPAAGLAAPAQAQTASPACTEAYLLCIEDIYSSGSGSGTVIDEMASIECAAAWAGCVWRHLRQL